jgi:antitoxin (DNA-binding transcriptional repressor) of toxin-antitoxin stability system
MFFMTIPITRFKARCLELIKNLEPGAKPIQITRHGKVVACVVPPLSLGKARAPWQRLHGSGALLAQPGESVVADSDFKALRGKSAFAGLRRDR